MSPSLPLLDLMAVAPVQARGENTAAALPGVFLELLDGCLDGAEEVALSEGESAAETAPDAAGMTPFPLAAVLATPAALVSPTILPAPELPAAEEPQAAGGEQQQSSLDGEDVLPAAAPSVVTAPVPAFTAATAPPADQVPRSAPEAHAPQAGEIATAPAVSQPVEDALPVPESVAPATTENEVRVAPADAPARPAEEPALPASQPAAPASAAPAPSRVEEVARPIPKAAARSSAPPEKTAPAAGGPVAPKPESQPTLQTQNPAPQVAQPAPDVLRQVEVSRAEEPVAAETKVEPHAAALPAEPEAAEPDREEPNRRTDEPSCEPLRQSSIPWTQPAATPAAAAPPKTAEERAAEATSLPAPTAAPVPMTSPAPATLHKIREDSPVRQRPARTVIPEAAPEIHVSTAPSAGESRETAALTAPPSQTAPEDNNGGGELPVRVRPLRAKASQGSERSELAFAARVKEEPPAETAASAPSRPSSPARVTLEPRRAEAAMPASSEAPADPTQARSSNTFTIAAPQAETRASVQDVASRPPAAPASAPADVAPSAPEAPAVRPASPARDIAIQVAGENGRVEIRVAEREGEIRMAVHSPQRELASELREQLPELAGRLERNGWSTETWRPEPAASRTDSGSFSREDGEGGWQGSGREDGRQGRGQEQRQPRPEWLAELEETEERSEPEWQAFQIP